MTAPPLLRVEIDGRPADAESLLYPATTAYGHFTAMQVRGGATRGLALHLERLRAATWELWERELDGERVRGLVRHALGDTDADASVRVYVHCPEDEPTVMVTVRGPQDMAARPQALQSVAYRRPAAHLKHLGGFGQNYYGQRARAAGFDDVLLVEDDGRVLEGGITNVGFLDSAGVVWPDGPSLAGITMQLVEARLAEAGIASRRGRVMLDGLGAYRAAFVTNSQGLAPVRRIDDTVLPVDEKLMARLGEVYAGVPWDRL
ncbi:aminotransferase class IV [Streptomyces indicus]|uniref:Branched-chain amino acid aminotransferase/4-amino-4-deoxychorismate lyase n=1 Tax=Streptomyces indicus TaxID=417292 RepID=A0A1G9D7R0_9ACTN|nr:aminotransferase class IV [Streptomyces indicus]SDK59960.1 Branched-chain amino acid aminotransferase/4-amino-4-deoxychorismate lyase [Streptomyces indicus]